MRAHGVPNFPDPTPGPGGGEGFSFNFSPGGVISVDGIAFSGPAFQSAATTCQRLGAGTPILPPRLSESQVQPAVARAQCLRRHGVPNIPDPILAPGGYGIIFHVPPGFNWEAPAVKNAARACADTGRPLPHEPA
jgi:hypothetical protein